jgi:2-oxoglutarate dehydrogenase E1 component
LNNLQDKQGKFYVYNSLLSEYAALGFEYGYSTTTPKDLTLWEAQFGDFSNGAQIIIDQFIASAEAKWSKFSGLTLLLPHGHEGQGPEHSSARPERFLQLCAGSNMQVLNCTTPANLFHALCRQLKRNFSMPLVIMTPKSLLRHPKCVSALDELSTGAFQELIPDSLEIKKARKVLFCTGKIYYDLLDYREANNIKDVAIVRIEQLYPLPEWLIKDIFSQYQGADFAWVQEEPMNQGAWLHLHRYDFPSALKYYGRRSSASPATGFKKVHDREQAEIVSAAFS